MASISRVTTLGLALLGLGLTQCDADGPGDGIAHACDESLAEGTACDFTDECGRLCPGTLIQCRGGVVLRGVGRCDAGAFDAATIEPFDAGVDTGAVDTGVGDTGDAGMCGPRTPEGVTPCRSNADCAAATGERCLAPDERPGCGICMDPPRDCALDSDCPTMDGVPYVCEEAAVPCPCSGDGLGTYCTAPCSVTGCSEGYTCGSNGHCAADACTAGHACPLGTTCESAGVGDAHGCVRATCTSDAECPCGAGCVEGHCYDVLGVCEPLRG